MAHIYPRSGIFTHDLPALRKSTVEYFHRSGRKSYRRLLVLRLLINPGSVGAQIMYSDRRCSKVQATVDDPLEEW